VTEATYLDTGKGPPERAVVDAGLFGTKRSCVPLTAARPGDDGVTVPFDEESLLSQAGHGRRGAGGDRRGIFDRAATGAAVGTGVVRVPDAAGEVALEAAQRLLA
jgi:hypothetical protein